MTSSDQKFVDGLRLKAAEINDWNAFENYWTKAVAEYYAPSGLSRSAIRQSEVYQAAQSIGSSLAVAAGIAVSPSTKE